MERLNTINTIFLIIMMFVPIIGGLGHAASIFSNASTSVTKSLTRPQEGSMIGKIVDYYPCTVGLNMIFNADFDGVTTDFSKYEDDNLIVFTSYHSNEPPEDLANIDTMMFIPHCVVYEYEGGYFDWEEF